MEFIETIQVDNERIRKTINYLIFIQWLKMNYLKQKIFFIILNIILVNNKNNNIIKELYN